MGIVLTGNTRTGEKIQKISRVLSEKPNFETYGCSLMVNPTSPKLPVHLYTWEHKRRLDDPSIKQLAVLAVIRHWSPPRNPILICHVEVDSDGQPSSRWPQSSRYRTTWTTTVPTLNAFGLCLRVTDFCSVANVSQIYSSYLEGLLLLKHEKTDSKLALNHQVKRCLLSQNICFRIVRITLHTISQFWWSVHNPRRPTVDSPTLILFRKLEFRCFFETSIA